MYRNTYIPRSTVPGIQWPAISNPPDERVLALIGQLEQSQWWSPDNIQMSQLTHLTYRIRHAARTVPFYKERLNISGHSNSHILSLDQFQEIEVFTRADVQAHLEEFISSALPSGHSPVSKISTSGSTGKPLTMLSTPVTRMMHRTLGLRSHLWQQRDPRARNMTIRPNKSSTRPKVSQGSGWMACYGRGPSFNFCATLPISQLYEGLQKHNPVYLQAYPSIVQELIRLSKINDFKPAALKEVRTYGGVLTPELRELCRDAWNVPVTDNYSAIEIGIMALQCPETSNLHVQSENVLLEVLRADGMPCKPGEVGRVVISVLNNLATPLIRYDIGDLAEMSEPCPCGRGLPTLKRIVGRDMHVFQLPDGSRVVPNVRSDQFADIAPVLQFQVVQSTLSDIDVNLVIDRPLTSEEESALVGHLKKHLHTDFRYQLHYMDEVPRGATGKFEMLRSDVT